MANFTMYRGDTKYLDLAITKNSLPLDLTGAKVWMSGVRNKGDSTYVFQKTSESLGIDVTNALGGLVTVTLDPTDTSSLPAEEVSVYYDVQVRETDGTVSTVQSGIITVTPDVTIEIA